VCKVGGSQFNKRGGIGKDFAGKRGGSLGSSRRGAIAFLCWTKAPVVCTKTMEKKRGGVGWGCPALRAWGITPNKKKSAHGKQNAGGGHFGGKL